MQPVRIDIRNGIFNFSPFMGCPDSHNVRSFWREYKKERGYSYTSKIKVKGYSFTHVYLIRGDESNGMGIAFI